MRRSGYLTLGVTAVALMFATSASAVLTIDKDSAKCRAGFQKGMGKVAATVQKGVGGCFKNDLKAGGDGSGCYVPAAYDPKSKAVKAKTKLTGSAAKCKNAGPGTYEDDMLALYGGVCPSPGSGAVTTLAELATCLGDLAEKQTVNTLRDIFRSVPVTPASKDAQKCSGTLFKGVGKLVATALKDSGKCQATIEKGLAKVTSPGNYPGYGCFGSDAKGKVAGAQTKLTDALPGGAKAKCTTADLEALGVAGGAEFASTIGDSGAALAALGQVRAGHVRSLYEGLGQQGWEGGQCPVSAQIRLVSAFNAAAQRVSGTNLDTGFKGVSHGVDLPGQFLSHVSLDCSGSPDCSACAIAIDPQFEGNRCSNDNTIRCDEPFVADADDCAGNICEVRFGPPLALSSANTPVCIDNVLSSVAGTANAGTGESATTVGNTSNIFSGLTNTHPCSSCDGDPTANDGVRGGTCNGGPDNGNPCDVNAISLSDGFGSTSYDCSPGGSNLSGTGLKLTLTFDTGTSVLSDTATTGDAACGPGNVLDCQCATCSLDSTVPCNVDADCSGVGAGVCDSNGTGVARLPNDCDTDAFVCNDDGDGLTGHCPTKTSSFCDAITHASGDPYLACATNADCAIIDPECGGDCGDCTITTARPCFLPDIVVSGNPSQQQTTVAGNFCIPGLGAAGSSVNTAAGLAGPGRLATDFEIMAFCDSPATKQFVGNGGNCGR